MKSPDGLSVVFTDKVKLGFRLMFSNGYYFAYA